MNSPDFDRVARVLAGTANRRASLRVVIAGAFGLAGAAASEERGHAGDRRGPRVEGPCGDGSRRANACHKNKECCTGYCQKGLKNKDGKGRCRCIKRGEACKPSQTCCAGACVDRVCGRAEPEPVPTGQPCNAASDTCADAAASCIGYDSDDPAGTYCLLPTGAACAGNGDCYSQDCSGGACAAVACTVCESGCPYNDLTAAIISPPADGRIKIAPGTWISMASSANFTQSMRIEACGGAPGVVLKVNPSQYFLLYAKENMTLTVKNVELAYVASTVGIGATGISAQAMAAVNAIGCTFHGGPSYFGLYPWGYFTATFTNCTFESAPVFAGADEVGDPSSMTFENCSFTGVVEGPVISIEGDLDVSFTGCTISGGANGGVQYTQNAAATTATVTLVDTVVSSNASPLSGGGGIRAITENGASVTVVLGDGVSVTGNSAPAGRGSGILAWGESGGVVTITGAPGKVSGNTPDPQCAITTNGSTYSPVAGCAY